MNSPVTPTLLKHKYKQKYSLYWSVFKDGIVFIYLFLYVFFCLTNIALYLYSYFNVSGPEGQVVSLVERLKLVGAFYKRMSQLDMPIKWLRTSEQLALERFWSAVACNVHISVSHFSFSFRLCMLQFGGQNIIHSIQVVKYKKKKEAAARCCKMFKNC